MPKASEKRKEEHETVNNSRKITKKQKKRNVVKLAKRNLANKNARRHKYQTRSKGQAMPQLDVVAKSSKILCDNKKKQKSPIVTPIETIIIDDDEDSLSSGDCEIIDTVTVVAGCSIRSPENGDTEIIGKCPICLKNLPHDTVVLTTCGHLFCMQCIESAFEASHSGEKQCPKCFNYLVQQINGLGYIQLFL